jgi:hypothetical protein
MNEQIERIDLDTAYRAVRGALPRRREVAEWKEQQFLDFINFIEHFCEPKRGTLSVIVTKAKWEAAEKTLDLPYHPWQEILYRIDRLTKDTRFNAGSIYIRIAAYNRAVLGYLKNNPAAVTDEMRKKIEPNPRLNWCLKQFTDTTTKIGTDIVLPHTTDATGSYPKPIAHRSGEKMMLEGQMRVFNLFEIIAGSIKAKEVKELDVRDKISALQKLSFIFNAAKSFKANSQTFINLNVNAAKREDLEKALLDFGKHKEQADV